VREYLRELVQAAPTPADGRNVAREYLQAKILANLQRAGAMVPLAFHGGTLLRFLFRLPRYSEDLDFALERSGDLYDFRRYLRAVRSGLLAEGYDVDLKVSDRRIVHSAFVRFPGLPHDLGLSPHRDEVLSVKVEVDTNPPAGAVLETSVTRRLVTLQLQHHDRASLLAGKLHAILQRPFVKGRDWYDLLWYLGDPAWPPPNLALLNDALRQTGWEAGPIEDDTWRAVVRDRVVALPWGRVVADVRPFLEISSEAELLTRDNLLRLLA
jgi:predicted nucleotidyltransferase component of viral defense system